MKTNGLCLQWPRAYPEPQPMIERNLHR